MKISGFTIVRNGDFFDYPFVESIRSLLPLVDELVVNIGNGTDQTADIIENLKKTISEGSKIKTIYSTWPLDDPDKRRSGVILSEQTNLALEHCTGDWSIYLQADELIHEEDYDKIKLKIQEATSRSEIDGLLFEYLHFYGSYSVIQNSRSAYRREVRAFKSGRSIKSFGDAQSFTKANGSKLLVLHSNARVFHYGWVRTPDAMKEKTYFMDQLYHGEATMQQALNKIPHTKDNYKYKKFWGLYDYKKSHPLVMKDRISLKNWIWDLKNSPLIWSWRDLKKIILDTFESLSGIRLFEYRSYKIKQ